MKLSLTTVTALVLFLLFGFFPTFNMALAGGGMTRAERNQQYKESADLFDERTANILRLYDEYDEVMLQQHRPYIPGSDGEREVIMHVDPYGRTSYEIRNPDMVDRAGAGFDYGRRYGN